MPYGRESAGDATEEDSRWEDAVGRYRGQALQGLIEHRPQERKD